jgi:hypothetical protein
MAYRTWVISPGGHSIKFKGPKAQAKVLARELEKVLNIQKYFRRLWGIKGEDEKATIIFSVFGKGDGEIANVEEYQAEAAALFALIPDLVTVEIGDDIIQQANDIFQKHVPEVDERETREEREEKVTDWQQAEAERLAERLAWVDEHCRDRKKIEIKEGEMGIYVRYTYNNSDLMTDYFDSQAGWGEDMLLAIVKKGAKRESVARRVLDLYPDLAALEWSWHTENYSMGRGNYLLSSDSLGEIKGRRTYGGIEDPLYRPVVRFQEWPGLMYAYKDYPGGASEETDQAQAEVTEQAAGSDATNGVEVTHDRDWTWIKFPAKPSEQVRTALKALGGRWGRRRGAWYIKRRVEPQTVLDAIEKGASAPDPGPTGEDWFLDAHL